MNRSLSSRSMRFATWVLLASLAIGNPQNLHAGLYSTQAAAGITTDLVPKSPVLEGGVMTLGVNTNCDVEFPGCFRWFKGGLLSEKQGVDEPILNAKGVVIGYKSTLSFQPAKKSDTGVYSCDVLGTDGKSVRSSLVQYLVASKPQIVLQPRSKLVVDSREFTLRVDPLTSSQAAFNAPAGVAVDRQDDEMIYVADTENSLIRRVTPGGSVSLFAGTTGTIDPNSFRIDNPGSNYSTTIGTLVFPTMGDQPEVFFDGRNGGGGITGPSPRWG
ncbi:MAG: hypothetical protein RLZZ244_2283 [Verrucomicrobiota bacterium]